MASVLRSPTWRRALATKLEMGQQRVQVHKVAKMAMSTTPTAMASPRCFCAACTGVSPMQQQSHFHPVQRKFSSAAPKTVLDSISESFNGAYSNEELVEKIYKAVEPHGYSRDSSLVATSLCCDELALPLESALKSKFEDHFSMGGLAGFPFGGVTSFGAMAAHIPDGGSCLVVFGPHVGVDTTGATGTVERRGREAGGACCGSAVAACGHVLGVHRGETEAGGPPTDPVDAQQQFVAGMLLPHGERLATAENTMVELPYALYDAQKEMIEKIIGTAAGNVAGEGKIAALGGIQINTPPDMSDYFLPLSFDLYDNKGTVVENLLTSLK